MSEQSLQEPTENDWKIDPAVNDGFPASAVILEEFNYLKSKSVWKIHASANDGFPHIQGVFEITPTPSIFPRFTGFSLSGIGADFKTVSQSTAVSLPEEMYFRFPNSDTLNFQFSKNQEVIL